MMLAALMHRENAEEAQQHEAFEVIWCNCCSQPDCMLDFMLDAGKHVARRMADMPAHSTYFPRGKFCIWGL